jgi:hypothetical protein
MCFVEFDEVAMASKALNELYGYKLPPRRCLVASCPRTECCKEGLGHSGSQREGCGVVLFSKQRGYKRLCFRNKQNGPMCFVEFDEVAMASKAVHAARLTRAHTQRIL